MHSKIEVMFTTEMPAAINAFPSIHQKFKEAVWNSVSCVSLSEFCIIEDVTH